MESSDRHPAITASTPSGYGSLMCLMEWDLTLRNEGCLQIVCTRVNQFPRVLHGACNGMNLTCVKRFGQGTKNNTCLY